MTNVEEIADLKEALKEVDTFRKIYYKQRKVSVEYEKRYKSLSLAIKALEQQPKMGHWIWKSGKMIDYCSCSVCKKGQWEIEWNYCPNCGAEMEVEK